MFFPKQTLYKNAVVDLGLPFPNDDDDVVYFKIDYMIKYLHIIINYNIKQNIKAKFLCGLI